MSTFTEYLEAQMQEIIERGGADPENDHAQADEILVAAAQSAGFQTLTDLYERVPKWYAPTSFTDLDTKEDHVVQLLVGYTTDPEKAQRARDMGATVTTCASRDPRFTGYEITLRVIDP